MEQGAVLVAAALLEAELARHGAGALDEGRDAYGARRDHLVARREPDAARAPLGETRGDALLREAPRRVLDERDPVPAAQEALDSRVVADVRGDAEEDHLGRVEDCEERLEVRVRERAVGLLQHEELSAALDELGRGARVGTASARAATDRAGRVSAIFVAPWVPRRQWGGKVDAKSGSSESSGSVSSWSSAVARCVTPRSSAHRTRRAIAGIAASASGHGELAAGVHEVDLRVDVPEERPAHAVGPSTSRRFAAAAVPTAALARQPPPGAPPVP